VPAAPGNRRLTLPGKVLPSQVMSASSWCRNMGDLRRALAQEMVRLAALLRRDLRRGIDGKRQAA
jgi:hypothetical protein